MNKTNRNHGMIDILLFSGFLACFFVSLTGVGLHQWLGIAAGLIAIYHLINHREWVVAVSKRLIGRVPGQVRLYYLIDALLFAGFVLMIITGLVISTWFNLSVTQYAAWHAVHVISSVICLGFVLIKLILHQRWIRSMFVSKVAVQSPAPARVAVTVDVDAAGRRKFLKMMAVAGALSLLAVSKPLKNLATTVSTADQDTGTQVASTEDTVTTSRTTSNSSGTCAVRCGKRCSYPGHCRRYVDSSGNGRCDLGECVS